MVDEKKLKLLDLYNKGLAAYKERKWDSAISYFKQALEVDPKDGPSKLYLARSENYKETPPAADWDGVFTMTTK